MTESESIPVISKDGVRGKFVGGLPAEQGATHALVAFETGQQLLVPLDALRLQADGRYYYLALLLSDIEQHGGGAAQPAEQPYVLPVIAEELEITRRRVETGRLRVQKRVHTTTELVDEPLLREHITVERVPVNRVIEQPVGLRQEGDTLIVPVLEEVLVVEKRLVLREEVRITRHTDEAHEPQQLTLRREEVTVVRVDPVAPPPNDGKDRAI